MSSVLRALCLSLYEVPVNQVTATPHSPTRRPILPCSSFIFFFFQAEDGIRDPLVTGVQTCALPIYGGASGHDRRRDAKAPRALLRRRDAEPFALGGHFSAARIPARPVPDADRAGISRSEERRVGKECRCGGSRKHYKKSW